MEKITPALSIIVPVYNVEQYLPRCIDSILAQTFQNFELILVDDGSKDKSGEICDEYTKKDNRIIVIHQENKGVNTARNAGLDIATGSYITFVDSDDWIQPDSYCKSIELMENNQEIDLLQYPEIHIKNGSETWWPGYPQEHIILTDTRNMIKALIGSSPIIPGGLCGKIYRKQLWKNLRLHENMSFCEDMITMPKLITRCRTIIVSHKGGYYYVSREGSATHSSFTPKKCLDVSRLKMQLFESALQYNIEAERWWSEATLAIIDAWTAFGPCSELKLALNKLQKAKKSIAHCKCNKRIAKIAYHTTPLLAAQLNRAIIKSKKIFR